MYGVSRENTFSCYFKEWGIQVRSVGIPWWLSACEAICMQQNAQKATGDSTQIWGDWVDRIKSQAKSYNCLNAYPPHFCLQVQLSVYGYYIRAIGIMSTCMTVVFYILSQACTVGSNVWLTAWSSESALQNETGQDPAVRDKYLGVYGALGIGQGKNFILDLRYTFL